MSMIEKLNRRATLFGRMLERLEVDVDQAARSQAFGLSARTCIFCPNATDCAEWFAEGAHGNAYRQFCPNARRIEGMPQRHLRA
ncbi:MAG: hypothetical protein KIT81_14075 [Alphaproteobacteria bacterium]|nr:hypothetical protein [Alphaproteobacteria bacterium]